MDARMARRAAAARPRNPGKLGATQHTRRTPLIGRGRAPPKTLDAPWPSKTLAALRATETPAYLQAADLDALDGAAFWSEALGGDDDDVSDDDEGDEQQAGEDDDDGTGEGEAELEGALLRAMGAEEGQDLLAALRYGLRGAAQGHCGTG